MAVSNYRHKKILEMVYQRKSVSADELAAEFGVSKITIRRDLDTLAMDKLLERPLRRFASNEATSEGAWMAACVATGLAASHALAFERLAQRDPPTDYTPEVGHFEVYRRQAARSQAVYDALAAPHLRAMAG